jgi:hypothetical protein
MLLPGKLVVGAEPGWVGGLGDLAINDFLEGVFALPIGIEGVHQMPFYFCDLLLVMFRCFKNPFGRCLHVWASSVVYFAMLGV